MLQWVGEPVSIEVPTNFPSFTSHTGVPHTWADGGEILCVNEHPSPLQAPPWTISELQPCSNQSDRVCRSPAFTQEPVQCAAYAHCIAAERSHPQKVLRGQACPAQHARTTKEPDRWWELYPFYRVSEPGLSDHTIIIVVTLHLPNIKRTLLQPHLVKFEFELPLKLSCSTSEIDIVLGWY